MCGSVLRIILEFALPKDGSLVAYGKYALQYGKGLPGLPSFMLIDPPSEQATAPIWNPDKDTCTQGECWSSGVLAWTHGVRSSEGGFIWMI